MDSTQALLQQLRDVHAPAPISWWPLAPGWYGVLAIIVLVLIILAWIGFRSWRKRRAKHRILQQLERAHANQNVAVFSMILRRVSLAKFKRSEVAGLQGEAWLTFLNQTNQPKTDLTFDSGYGHLLLAAPYQPDDTAIDQDAFEQLAQCVKLWVRHNL